MAQPQPPGAAPRSPGSRFRRASRPSTGASRPSTAASDRDFLSRPSSGEPGSLGRYLPLPPIGGDARRAANISPRPPSSSRSSSSSSDLLVAAATAELASSLRLSSPSQTLPAKAAASPPPPDPGNAVRVAVKLPSGARVQGEFPVLSTTIGHLVDFVQRETGIEGSLRWADRASDTLQATQVCEHCAAKDAWPAHMGLLCAQTLSDLGIVKPTVFYLDAGS
eukprot:m.33899 g.33899  ORF g.33899 m.33899 type:complete len:222 (+) comp5633_c0_seq2:182-847(+)